MRFIAVVGGVATTAIGGGGNDGPNRRNIRRGWWTPSVRGTPGVSNTRSADPDRFELDTRSWTTDRALARRRYAEATAAWDRHLAAIPSPPLRLVNCLLQREPAFVHPSPGGGQRRATMASTVDAIVAHHRAVDERCLNGEIPASSGAFPPDLPVVPPTPLSFFVSQWIVGLVRDTLRGVRTPDTVSAERIVGCLMENGADPSIFAVPVNELSGFRDDAFVAFNLLGHLRGASLLEHVRSFAKVATSWNRGNTEEGLSQRVVFRIGREVCKVYNTLAAAIDGHVLAKAGLPREVVISDEGRG